FPSARSSQQAYRELNDELYEISQVDIGYRGGGILKLAFDESDEEKLHDLLQQPSVHLLDDHEVSKVEPAVADHVVAAAYSKDEVNVIPTQPVKHSPKVPKCSVQPFLKTRTFMVSKS